MADTKVTGLTELTTLNSTDLLYAVDDPGGTPTSVKMTMENAAKAGMGLGSTDAFEVRRVLHEETLAAAGRFDVSGISQSYTHLEIRLLLRSDQAVAQDGVLMLFNGDTTATNYHYQRILTQAGATVTGAEASDAAIGGCPGSSGPANSFAVIKVSIPNYTGGHLKMAQATTSMLFGTDDLNSRYVSFVWDAAGGTAAINRITIQPDGYATDEFIAGSYCQIIGIKTVS